MPAAVHVEHFLAVQADLHRPAEDQRGLATTISWLQTSHLPPKPPPLGAATTRMCEAGICSTRASERCT